MNSEQKDQLRVLLADGDESMRSLLQEYLKRLGYDAFSAGNGREAIDIVRKKKPHLVILETILPELDGLEVCRVLKGHASTHDILFLFLSAKDDIDSKVNAFKAGADDYLTKPFSPRELEVRIEAVLGKRLPKAKLTPALEESRQVETSLRNSESIQKIRSTNKSKDPYRLVGTILNEKYELIEYTGGGGMGAVYRALRKVAGDVVAIKILKPDVVARSPEYAELFERETKNARSLDHPHIVKVFDSDKDDEISYMVMEWIEGSSIEDVITQEQLSIPRVIKIFEQVCSAVASAHKHGIIHLDLKPANILLVEDAKPDDFVKVIDFGLSRLISKESGTTVTKFRGTHQYCAPEQFGGRVSHKSDIYSLGATLYHLLTGVIPFGTSYINAKIHPNLDLPEIPSVTRQRDLPSAIDEVIKKALYKNPDLRHQSATQLFEEFRDAISSNKVSFQEGSLATNHRSGWPPQHVPKIKVSTEVDAEGVKILSRAIGIETLGGVFTKLIPEGTPLPCKTSEIFSTATDNQTQVEIHVLTGLRPLAQQNLSLGKFHLTDIPPSPRGVPQIEVTFDVNIQGVLTVSAKDIKTGREHRITITSLSGPSREEIAEIFREAENRSRAGTRTHDEINEQNPLNRVDYVSQALRAASTYPVAEELLQHIRELEEAVKKSGYEDRMESALSEEINYLQGEINGLYKLSEGDIASHMTLKDAQTLLFKLRESPHPEKVNAPGAGNEKSDEDSEYSFVLDAAREVTITNRQRQWRASEEGVSTARQEVNTMYASLERRVKIANGKLAAAEAPIGIELNKENDDHFILSSGPYSLSIRWNCKADNTLEDSVLSVDGYKDGVNGERYSTAEYDFEMNRDLAIGWRRRESRERFISTDDLAKEILWSLVSHIRNQAMYNK